VKKVHFSLPWVALLQVLSQRWALVVSLTIIETGKRLNRVMKVHKIINSYPIPLVDSKISNSVHLGVVNLKNDFSLGCLSSHSRS
jgi:hypothetical protein